MISRCASAFVKWPLPSYSPTVCAIPSEQLRQQLDNLHKEANSARAKANNARLRFIRLSEAAENFRRQAASSVQTGKENDARKLLFQKRKVMQAMETLKTRIELFDELSTKLNEAISLKEGLLIGNISLVMEFSETEAPSSVRIVSQTAAHPDESFKNQLSVSDQVKGEEGQESDSVSEIDSQAEYESDNISSSIIPKSSEELDNANHGTEISSYVEFLKHIDKQLEQIEEKLETVLSVSSLLLESKTKPEYLKVQQVMDILKGVYDTRERISTIIQSKMDLEKVLD